MGCEDLIEEPKSILSQESFFKSENDLQAAVVACYSALIGSRGGAEDYGWNALDVRSWALNMGADDMTSARGYNKERLLEFDEFRISTNNIDNRNTWETLYQVIAACNMVIANYERVSMEEEAKKQLAAQSYFLRGFCYFRAVRYWGEIPLITSPVEDGGFDIVRSPVLDVYDVILKAAQFAEEYLPVEWPGEPGAATKGAAKTLLANVYLTMAGWPLQQSDKYALAAQKAKEVIDMGIYNLMTDFKANFNVATKNNMEHIWNVQAVSSENYWSKFGISFLPPEEGGWHDYLGEVRFFQQFPEGNRKDATYYTVFKKGATTYNWEDSKLGLPCFSKFWNADQSDKKDINGDHLFPIYRYAEVLLIYAEAQNRVNGGPDQSCYDALNAIRNRAKGSSDQAPTGLSEQEFDQLVFEEKGWEFAAEQKRWDDLVRKELVEKYNEDNPFHAAVITKDNYIFPIPATEREINPNITQNQGY